MTNAQIHGSLLSKYLCQQVAKQSLYAEPNFFFKVDPDPNFGENAEYEGFTYVQCF